MADSDPRLQTLLRLQQGFAWPGGINGHQNGHQLCESRIHPAESAELRAYSVTLRFRIGHHRAMSTMKARFRLIRRNERGGAFYCIDNNTGTRTSLNTRDGQEARRLVNAKNEAHAQPALNLQIARACLSASDPEIRTRTWQHVMDAMSVGK